MGNVLSVEHHREGMDMPVTESEIELTLMMRDQDHCAALVRGALEAHGYRSRASAMSARRERKVVTVLFADLVGFTSRAESLDPEDVALLLERYHDHLRSELERFGGTVEKFIGDAVMALFGAPAAHEDDPERAVRAALAIRDWAREREDLSVRVGLTTGEVWSCSMPQPAQAMAAGDVVNTASRLQAAAPEERHPRRRDDVSGHASM